MALYRAQDGSAQNSAEKQNRKRVRRTSDHQNQAGLFDLRGNRQGSDITELDYGRQPADPSSTYKGRQPANPADLPGENRDPGFSRFEFDYGDAESSERPYRERHRVEVKGKETSAQESGARGLYGSSSDTGRVVRGNVPSSRRLRDDMLSDNRGNARGGSVRSAGRSEVSSDLFPLYSGRTGSSARGSRDRTAGYSTGTYTDLRGGRTGGNSGTYADTRGTRVSGTGANSGAYADTRGTRVSGTGGNSGAYAGTRGIRVSGTGGNSSRYADARGTAAAPQNTRKDWTPDEYLRQNGGLDIDSYDPEYGRKNASGSGNSAVSRDDPEERARRRRESRKEREKQLRRQYIRLGIGAAVLLFLLVFGVVAAIRIFRGDDSSGTEAASMPAQVTADAGQETSSESGKKDQKETSPSEDAAEETADQPGVDNRTEERSEDSSGKKDSQPENTPENTEENLQEETEDGLQKKAEDILQEDEEDSLQEEDAGPEGTLAGSDRQQSLSDQDLTGAAPGLDSIPAGTGQSALTEVDLRAAEYVRQDEWNMILVNRWNPLPDGYTVETSALMNGESIDSRCYSQLQAMLNDCAAAGGQPVVCSSYRPHEKQVGLYKEQVDNLLADGLSQEEAEAEAATAVAVPGTSEHELGLAVDICDYNHQILDESQAETPTQQWLMEHCWDYGFILRYPLDKSDITGIIYEPWHYRYVGVEDAGKIHEMNICLEEYLAQ